MREGEDIVIDERALCEGVMLAEGFKIWQEARVFFDEGEGSGFLL